MPPLRIVVPLSTPPLETVSFPPELTVPPLKVPPDRTSTGFAAETAPLETSPEPTPIMAPANNRRQAGDAAEHRHNTATGHRHAADRAAGFDDQHAAGLHFRAGKIGAAGDLGRAATLDRPATAASRQRPDAAGHVAGW